MIEAGRSQTLYINRFTPQGAYLVADLSDRDEENPEEVLLPYRYLTDGMKEGDSVGVFVYYDSEDRIVATTDVPDIKVGEVACFSTGDFRKIFSCRFPTRRTGLWWVTGALFMPISTTLRDE